MQEIAIELPESIVEQLREWAERDGIPMNKFITIAIAEKMATRSTIEARAKRATRARFKAALARVPDVEPALQDRFPAKRKKSTSSAKTLKGNSRRKP